MLFSSTHLRKYSLPQILTFSLCTSLAFEGLLPHVTSYNVGDWGDVIAYFSGGVFYYYGHQNLSIKNWEIHKIEKIVNEPMDTKEKILNGALELYNSKGINVSTRHIAAHISISPGNLHYHFKHTDDIVKELYNRLVAAFDELIKDFKQSGAIDRESLKSVYLQSFSIEYKYRFILLNFVEIGKRVPSIQAAYRELVKRRKAEFALIFRKMVSVGYFRSDLPNEIWESLATTFFILGDFWLSHNELIDKLKEYEAAVAYSKLMEYTILPLLADPNGS
ncbi:TetR/AcrR family transcriptional regulator [Pedobacter caeni]|uniref:Transcriptional regulator, TetR family n=1 Tax=Pedobacter caeni TaxID=288992 RepID=A0A1M4TQM1_9SPHI|nr:TetR/AcrR family transcriptional regulator [Pedobacter caeni]SHE46684.1 transcriptional regulator, TetR family [Pedobacter caeni]